MKEFVISQELAQAILNYLQTRPFQEVHAMISELVKLEPAPEKNNLPVKDITE